MRVEEKPEEEGQNSDELDTGSVIGIIIACLVTALLVLIIMIVAIIAVFHERKKRVGKANLKSVDPDMFTQ